MTILTHSNFENFINKNSHLKPALIGSLRSEILSYSLYTTSGKEKPLFNQNPLIRFLESATLWEKILVNVSDWFATCLTVNVLVHCYVVENKSSDVFFAIPKEIDNLIRHLSSTKKSIERLNSRNNSLISPIQACSDLLKIQRHVDGKSKAALEKNSIGKFHNHLNQILAALQLCRAADRFNTKYFKESLDLSPFMETNDFYVKKPFWTRLFWIKFSILCFQLSDELNYVRKDVVFLANTLFDGETSISGKDIDTHKKTARLRKTKFTSSF